MDINAVHTEFDAAVMEMAGTKLHPQIVPLMLFLSALVRDLPASVRLGTRGDAGYRRALLASVLNLGAGMSVHIWEGMPPQHSPTPNKVEKREESSELDKATQAIIAELRQLGHKI